MLHANEMHCTEILINFPDRYIIMFDDVMLLFGEGIREEKNYRNSMVAQSQKIPCPTSIT